MTRLLPNQHLLAIMALAYGACVTACNSREKAEEITLPGTNYYIKTYVVDRSSAMGGGRMEVCAQKSDNDECSLLATFDDEDMTHVHVAKHEILIDVLDTTVGDAKLNESHFMGYGLRINPVQKF